MSLGAIFLVLILGAAAFALIYFVHWADRRRLIRHFASQGATVIHLERIIPARSVVSESNTTFWRVRYRAADGTVHVAECFASSLRCKVYRDDVVADT